MRLTHLTVYVPAEAGIIVIYRLSNIMTRSGNGRATDTEIREVVELSAEDLQLTVKNFENPDGYSETPNSKLKNVDFGPYRVLRLEFEPGWKWSEHAKPEVQTDWCENLHLLYVLSGRHHAKMKDGTEVEYGPGDLVLIPPGHDGWTVGDEPAVLLDLGALLVADPYIPE